MPNPTTALYPLAIPFLAFLPLLPLVRVFFSPSAAPFSLLRVFQFDLELVYYAWPCIAMLYEEGLQFSVEGSCAVGSGNTESLVLVVVGREEDLGSNAFLLVLLLFLVVCVPRAG